MFNFLLILPCFLIFNQPLNAKVEAPNYDFSQEILADFFPQKSKEDIEKKYGKPEIMSSKKDWETLKFYVSSKGYRFPILVQLKDGKVLDFFAKLPSSFLHDVFFKGLVDKFGKQTTYKKFGEEAVYVWEKDNLKQVYSAACTITCFPVFYSVSTTEKIPGHRPILESLK